MYKLSLLAIILLLISCKPEPQSTYRLDGALWDYDWANSKNHLAILMEEPEKILIYIIDAENGRIQQTIDMNSFNVVANITWTYDDQGLMILIPDEEGFTNTTLTFPLDDHKNIDTLGHLGAYYQTHILDANSNYLAVLSAGEGHPDITVYAKNKYEEEIFNSDVYPGGIGLMGWLGDTLLVESDMRLDYGLDREKRLEYAIANGFLEEDSDDETYTNILGPLDNYSVYEIAMETQKVIKVEMDPFAWEPVSFDRKYRVRPEKMEGEVPQTYFYLTKK